MLEDHLCYASAPFKDVEIIQEDRKWPTTRKKLVKTLRAHAHPHQMESIAARLVRVRAARSKLIATVDMLLAAVTSSPKEFQIKS